MILGALMLFAAADPSPTAEKFSIDAREVENSCRIKIEGTPTETPPQVCADALAGAPTARQRAILYFSWGYSLNEIGAALQALPSLDKAVTLAPNFSNARHERSYTLSDLGYYDRALLDSNREIELIPESASAYQERAFARYNLGDFDGSLADRFKQLELGESSDEIEGSIVADLMWLGRYDEAAKRLAAIPATDKDKATREDLERRRAFKPDGGEAGRCIEPGQNDIDQEVALKLVYDCTWAFDHERDPAKRADYLTMRGPMSVIAEQGQDLNVEDLRIAVGIDPKNPRRHINYGFALLTVRHSWAAHNEFETALGATNLDKHGKAMALTGRGQARFNLGDRAGAKADAKASFEAEPMEPNLWLIGDLEFADGDKDAARKTWMVLYRHGSRDDRLLERLKSVGVDDPAKEPK
jgi:tetratricopeptide (TPR) repeat protein